MSELVKKFDVHFHQINDWKKQLPSGIADVLGKAALKAEDAEQAVSKLHVKIGQLTRACPMSGASALGMENDFLERRLTRIHGPRGNNWCAQIRLPAIFVEMGLGD